MTFSLVAGVWLFSVVVCFLSPPSLTPPVVCCCWFVVCLLLVCCWFVVGLLLVCCWFGVVGFSFGHQIIFPRESPRTAWVPTAATVVRLSQATMKQSHLIKADLFGTRMQFQPDVYVTECSLWTRDYLPQSKPLTINTEFDAAHYIRSILGDAIYAAKLKLRLSAEVTLSSRFRTDFLVLRQNGLPVGVIEVKKPDKSDLMEQTQIFGELFDYMMFLKSTYNIQRVFGILTRYSDWYVCWLEDTPSPASSSSPSSPPPMRRYQEGIAPFMHAIILSYRI